MLEGYTLDKKYSMRDLLKIMEILRSENGCPWDKEQNHKSIRNNFLEETYEVMEAIDNDDKALMREELGDVLLQVVFHSQIEKEQGGFSFEDVCDEICKKLIIRHPHVFSNVIAETSKEVLNNWDEIKKSQKGQTSQTATLKSVPKVFPALMRSAKVQSRAAKVGFDYKDVNMAFNDLKSEMQELTEAMEQNDQEALFEELGDVLFSVVNVSRFLHLDAEQCLAASCDKFIRRFEMVEQLAKEEKIDMKTSSMDTLNELWNKSKKLPGDK